MRILLIGILVMLVSCKNRTIVEYYFFDNDTGFYAIVFNSINGVSSQKEYNKYKYIFKESNILLVKEPQLLGKAKVYYYLIDKDESYKKEIFIDDFNTSSNEIIVYFSILSSYTNEETNKDVYYQMLWIAPDVEMSGEEKEELEKKQNIQIQQLHQKIDSLVKIGEL